MSDSASAIPFPSVYGCPEPTMSRASAHLSLANDAPAPTVPGVPPAAPTDEDAPLVARAQAGDLAAFDVIVRRHQGMLAGLLHRFAGRPADVEDLVQETFLRAHRALPRWTPEQPFVHWLRRIAVNIGRDHCRARARRPLGEELPADDSLPATGDADPSAQAALAEVRDVLAQLPPDDCTLLTLQYLEGLPISEIASLLGWSLINTRVRSFRARRKLQQLLKQHGYQP